ncbi:ankyrin repeat domain-containing protein 49 [Paragonimus westermani]|uniref:Ankyrin repeat domain-containing protein 49 n=1 Tax=Paragonimus westermani TaxID=34504 RepID=A0A5J4N8G8_9TREM|nr:ankyrin repeat domain-containing protein 49 [Paragonimus westermani]
MRIPVNAISAILNTGVTDSAFFSPQHLLQLGADINIRTLDGWTPLHSAAFWNQFACVQLLLAAGAELNATTNSNQTPLHLAVSNSQTPETLYVLLSQPNISVYGIRNKLGDSVADLIIRNTQYADLCFAFSEAATSLGK